MDKEDKQEFINMLAQLWYEYSMYRFTKRKTFKGFMEWIASRND